ncbi:MAG: Sua5/YciO/YrdC/YwlC family protein, partial [Muribaculaceae bacterium]|nr:Sua5/YciO/YrdC/YwlC family protein [Muribaculaceae bacterium]
LAPDGSVGVRITGERVSAGLCRALRRPLVSTSANISGKPAPLTMSEIDPEIIEAVDAVVSAADAPPAAGIPSTVIKLSDGGVFKIIRASR